MTIKIHDRLVVRALSEIENDGGNTSGMQEGEVFTVVDVDHAANLVDIGCEMYGCFSIIPGRDGLSWKTFFTKQES